MIYVDSLGTAYPDTLTMLDMIERVQKLEDERFRLYEACMRALEHSGSWSLRGELQIAVDSVVW